MYQDGTLFFILHSVSLRAPSKEHQMIFIKVQIRFIELKPKKINNKGRHRLENERGARLASIASVSERLKYREGVTVNRERGYQNTRSIDNNSLCLTAVLQHDIICMWVCFHEHLCSDGKEWGSKAFTLVVFFFK